MSKIKKIYWLCQVSGWTLYVLINLFFFKLSYSLSSKDAFLFLIWIPLGIAITHSFKLLVYKWRILSIKLGYQSLFIVFSSGIMSLVFFILNVFILYAFTHTFERIDVVAAFSKILSLFLIFMVWSALYFGFHFFDNYKQSEIQNWKLEASSKEIELNKLKSQLNPHFMFNSMNSIRALVDEDPLKAKAAVTKLSNILRHTLMLHKNRFISLEEEIKIVTDYLELEHIRYEERLKYTFSISPDTLQLHVPPMIIQTLVENAIKHGVSKTTSGGSINIISLKHKQTLTIQIFNTGQLDTSHISDTGFGVQNTQERLTIVYNNNATFSIKNYNDTTVLAEIIINYV